MKHKTTSKNSFIEHNGPWPALCEDCCHKNCSDLANDDIPTLFRQYQYLQY